MINDKDGWQESSVDGLLGIVTLYVNLLYVRLVLMVKSEHKIKKLFVAFR